jgi:hypothetical protein
MKLGKIYREKSLQSQGVYDKKTLSLELLEAEFKPPTPMEVLLLVRIWDAQKWELSDLL